MADNKEFPPKLKTDAELVEVIKSERGMSLDGAKALLATYKRALSPVDGDSSTHQIRGAAFAKRTEIVNELRFQAVERVKGNVSGTAQFQTFFQANKARYGGVVNNNAIADFIQLAAVPASKDTVGAELHQQALAAKRTLDKTEAQIADSNWLTQYQVQSMIGGTAKEGLIDPKSLETAVQSGIGGAFQSLMSGGSVLSGLKGIVMGLLTSLSPVKNLFKNAVGYVMNGFSDWNGVSDVNKAGDMAALAMADLGLEDKDGRFTKALVERFKRTQKEGAATDTAASPSQPGVRTEGGAPVSGNPGGVRTSGIASDPVPETDEEKKRRLAKEGMSSVSPAPTNGNLYDLVTGFFRPAATPPGPQRTGGVGTGTP